MKWNEKKPPKVEDFVQIRLFVYFGTKSSTFGAFFLKILHFWLRKLEKPPPFFIRFFVKTWKTSTFGGFLLKSEDFVQNRLPILHFWCFFFSKIFHFWSLRPQQGASKLQNHFPACFFDGPHQSCKFRPDRRTLDFFYSKGPPFGYFPDFDKMQKNCIFCFSRYGPHFLTRYSGLPQEQF